MSAGFNIDGGKGFHITFENGWGLSVQFGGGNYCQNRDDSISTKGWRESGRKGSSNAEIAILQPDDTLYPHPEWEDVVKGWQTPKDILNYLIEIEAK